MDKNKEIYPLTLEVSNNISGGYARGQDEHIIIENENAIKMYIEIDSSQYKKKDIYESLNMLCQQVLEYYRE